MKSEEMMMLDEALVREAFTDCKPYLTCWKEMEGVVEELLKDSLDVHDFLRKLEKLIERESNILLKTDMKILLSELKSRFKRA